MVLQMLKFAKLANLIQRVANTQSQVPADESERADIQRSNWFTRIRQAHICPEIKHPLQCVFTFHSINARSRGMDALWAVLESG